MLSVEQAESTIDRLIRPLSPQQDTEVVSLEDALGRILAAPAVSQLDFPYWDNSAMDGYAVKHEDVQVFEADNPAVLEVIEEIPAGIRPQQVIERGQAARIFTGAMLPEGADTIVIQENTQRKDKWVQVTSTAQFGEFVRHKGTFYRAGEPLLLPGTVIGAAEIAVLATAQYTQLKVYRRPRVAILSTGDELIPPDRPLQPGQIIDSNQSALAAFVASYGGIPLRLGIVSDRPEALQAAISQALSADMILSTGGVSVGDYDYVEQILEQLGGTIHIRSVAVKPGKPLTVATFKRAIYFGLPGNPVSALVGCWRFVGPALKKLSGQNNTRPLFVKARSRQELKADGKRETYLWGQLQLVKGSYEFELAGGSHSSGNLINLAYTNALAVVPVGQTHIAVGEVVEVLQVALPNGL